MLKTADHCPSNKSGLAAMDIHNEPPQPPFLMASLLLLKFLLSTTIQAAKKVTMSFEEGKDDAPKLQYLLCAYLQSLTPTQS